MRLPASLKRELEAVARLDGTSLNPFIVIAAAKKLAPLRPADFFAERIARADVPAAIAIMDLPGGVMPDEKDRVGG